MAETVRARARPRRPRRLRRRTPALDRDDVSVHDALVRRFLRPRLAAFAGRGLVFGVGAESGWADVLPARVDVGILEAIGPSGRELHAAAAADWVVLDRCLQWRTDMGAAIEDVVGRMRAGAPPSSRSSPGSRVRSRRTARRWTVAPYAAGRLHEERRDLERVEVEQHGNVTFALAWIYRLPVDDLAERELAAADPAYPVLVAVTASKRGRRG